MKRLAPASRLLAFGGAVWVQVILASGGLHDPGCAHHRPGAPGEAHQHGPDPHAAHDRGAHQDGANDRGYPAPASPVRATPPPSDPDPGPSSDDCSCVGVCVPGALVGAPTLGHALPEAPTPALARRPTPEASPAAASAAVARLLPPATGPPLPA